MQPMYSIMNINRNISLASYEVLKNIKGLTCNLYYPIDEESVSEKSIFGLEDSIYYRENADVKKLLCFNLFQESFIGGNEFDAFLLDTYILTTFDEKIPLKTRVEIDFDGALMQFIVDDHKNVTPQVKKQMFIRNILVAAT